MAMTAPAPHRGLRSARTGPRVLLVEDHGEARKTLQLLLGMWGCEVATAADGQEGWQTAQSWEFDVAVLDLGLPQMDGYDLARQIRRELGGAVRLIALTGYGQPETRQRALEAGFDHFLTKPADLEELERLVTTN